MAGPQDHQPRPGSDPRPLLSTKTAEGLTGQRSRSNAELRRLGVGNMVAASVGGIPSGVNLTATFAAHRAGARTSVALLARTRRIYQLEM